MSNRVCQSIVGNVHESGVSWRWFQHVTISLICYTDENNTPEYDEENKTPEYDEENKTPDYAVPTSFLQDGEQTVVHECESLLLESYCSLYIFNEDFNFISLVFFSLYLERNIIDRYTLKK